MRYPTRTDYQTAMGNADKALLDPALGGGRVKRDPLGFAVAASGNFSTVFRVESGHRTWAVRCFVADVGDASAIYAAIARHLQRIQSPYFVGFEFQRNGIWIGKTKWPIVKMEWARGESLKSFLKKHLSAPHQIRALADAWRRMIAALSASQVAHGDLQHENLLIDTSGGTPEIKLIDYDTLVVPEVAGWVEGNAGLPAYQHPARRQSVTRKDLRVDNFSALAIHASLLAIAHQPSVWRDFDIELREGLLFDPEDFRRPSGARAFEVLRKAGGECERLGAALIDACLSRDPLQVPKIDDVLGGGASAAPAPPPQQPLTWWKPGASQAPPAGPAPVASPTAPPGPPAAGAGWWRAGATPTPAPVVSTSPFTPVAGAAQPPSPAGTAATAVAGPAVWAAQQASTGQVFPSMSPAAPPTPVPASVPPPPPSPTPPPPSSRRANKLAAPPPPRSGMSPAVVMAIVVLVLIAGVAAGVTLARRSDNPTPHPAQVLPPVPTAAPATVEPRPTAPRGGPCTGDEGCPAGQRCREGSCEDKPATSSLSAGQGCVSIWECGRGLTCRAGRCAPYGMSTPAPSAAPARGAKALGDGCAGDSECAGDLRCVSGTCALQRGVVSNCGRFERCRVRDDAGETGQIIEGCFKRPGDEVAVLGQAGIYLRIACPGGRPGYLQRQFVSLD